jgi:hypothetical protein
MKIVLLISFSLLGWFSNAYAQDPGTDMAIAAKRFLQSLDPNTKGRTNFKFIDKERENWHFFPGKFINPNGRKGLSLKEMTAAQKILAHGLLGSALSHRGLLEAIDIILLEQILFEREIRAFRDPELYHISLFGNPDTLGTWGWRFEGHHLSLNFTLVNGRIFSSTPSFFGSSPAKVFEGKHAGLKVLIDEAEKAYKLFRSLSESQKKLAILSEKAPQDILSGQDSTVDRKTFFPPNGLSITKLNLEQKTWLNELVHLYVAKHRPEVIKQISRRKPLVHPQETYIAWAGSLNLNEAHYFRVQTPDFLFEYANTQNDINHAHTVWRDFDGDFGRDFLADHYQKVHKAPLLDWEK